MTDLAVAQTAYLSETAPQRVARNLAEWLKPQSAFRPVKRSSCPAAWELIGITRIDRYDIAPWLSF